MSNTVKSTSDKPDLFAPHEPYRDDLGRLVLDRAFTAAEAEKLDGERRAEYERQEAEKFRRRRSGRGGASG